MDKAYLKKQLIDQSAHFVAAFIFLAPLLLCPAWWSGLIAGFGYGFVREVTEEGATITWTNVKNAVNNFSSQMDIAFWALGGMVAALLLA